ncbi:zinc finger BED domain-containing protein 4-like [Epinephelus lanceolatus]
MKAALLDAVRRRFGDVESEPLYALATLLDPGYKDKYFTNADTSGHAKEALKAEVVKIEEALETRPPSDETVSEPAEKTPRTEDAGSSLGSIFHEILEENRAAAGPSEQITPGALLEIESYFSEALLERKNNPLHYWGVNRAPFPTLATTAAEFLCAPCTSVESERLFNTASLIVETRSRLTAQHAEMLIFLEKKISTPCSDCRKWSRRG